MCWTYSVPFVKIGLPHLPKLGRGRGASPPCPFSAYGPVLTFVSSVCMTLDGWMGGWTKSSLQNWGHICSRETHFLLRIFIPFNLLCSRSCKSLFMALASVVFLLLNQKPIVLDANPTMKFLNKIIKNFSSLHHLLCTSVHISSEVHKVCFRNSNWSSKEASFNWKSDWFIDLAHGFLTLDKKWIN